MECSKHKDHTHSHCNECYSINEHNNLKAINERMRKDCREAINTTWRFIGAYKKREFCANRRGFKKCVISFKPSGLDI